YDVTISPVPTTSAVYTLSLHDALPISWTLCPAPVSFANAALLTKRALQSLWLPQGTGPSLVAGPLPRKAASKQALPGGDRDACWPAPAYDRPCGGYTPDTLERSSPMTLHRRATEAVRDPTSTHGGLVVGRSTGRSTGPA